MSSSEFVTFFNGIRMPTQQRVHYHVIKHKESGAVIPYTVDWRTRNVVTPVKTQQQCGSCWAFSAIGSLEGAHALKYKELVSLSEQNLVDCSKGNDNCEGGLVDDAFAYIQQNKGIDTQASYQYTADEGNCVFKTNFIGATLKSWAHVDSGSETALTDAIATVGPISVAVDASNPSFQLYNNGVYFESECSSSQLNHGMLVVGYGTKNGSDYYLVKNSWGTGWGMDGYIMMSRNKDNNCGIATMPSYPIV